MRDHLVVAVGLMGSEDPVAHAEKAVQRWIGGPHLFTLGYENTTV